ncbi:MAG: nucleotide exchange factor GrpE [Gammaproteobacteria bacterium]|nr:nucleotide exchange factor GrpE [Gammaproteobacteria bacterium]MCP5299821.1 nucleotide exchange factor GrpE [Chromatiaceae bacterium]
MGEQQGQPTQDKNTGGVAADEATFEDGAAEMEADSGVAEREAGDLAKLLDEARQKADQHYDQLMRAHAELENLKRRHSRDLENAHKFALDRFVAELLGVWDSLELGHSAAQDAADIDKLREGTELTLKMLGDAMAKFGVEQIDPIQQPFNPEFHQAMSMQPRADVPPNTVVAVVQKGYTLNGRLVRPAMVMVSQAAG